MTPLVGCTVVVTRERPGELGRLVAAAGGTVLHVPLIEIVEPLDGGRALQTELARLETFDWLIVTSPAGAERVGTAASAVEVRLGAVGSSTAARLAELAGRPVDLVPERQLAASLADAFVAIHDVSGAERDVDAGLESHEGQESVDGPESVEGRENASQRVLLVLGDRAADTLSETLTAAGHEVTSTVGYRTVARHPSPVEVDRIAGADALLLTSGSAAESWAATLGDRAAAAAPDLVVAIGPTTAEVARGCGLKVSATAADHSLAGVVDELVRRWRP